MCKHRKNSGKNFPTAKPATKTTLKHVTRPFSLKALKHLGWLFTWCKLNTVISVNLWVHLTRGRFQSCQWTTSCSVAITALPTVQRWTDAEVSRIHLTDKLDHGSCKAFSDHHHSCCYIKLEKNDGIPGWRYFSNLSNVFEFAWLARNSIRSWGTIRGRLKDNNRFPPVCQIERPGKLPDRNEQRLIHLVPKTTNSATGLRAALKMSILFGNIQRTLISVPWIKDKKMKPVITNPVAHRNSFVFDWSRCTLVNLWNNAWIGD